VLARLWLAPACGAAATLGKFVKKKKKKEMILGKLSSSLTALGKHRATNKEDRGTGQLPTCYNCCCSAVAQPLRASWLSPAQLNVPVPTARLGSTSCPGRLVPARLQLALACGAAATLGQCAGDWHLCRLAHAFYVHRLLCCRTEIG